ncbi:helix-turn-helix transcriptional regulator [Alkalihalobacillus sp. FSL R5-0424]
MSSSKSKLRLKELRLKHNLDQLDLADYLGVHRSTYSKYEKGHRGMQYETVIKLVEFYKVSLDYIYGLSDDPIRVDLLPPDEAEYVHRSLEAYKKVKDTYFKDE